MRVGSFCPGKRARHSASEFGGLGVEGTGANDHGITVSACVGGATVSEKRLLPTATVSSGAVSAGSSPAVVVVVPVRVAVMSPRVAVVVMAVPEGVVHRSRVSQESGVRPWAAVVGVVAGVVVAGGDVVDEDVDAVAGVIP
jgi:hypothetical protein